MIPKNKDITGYNAEKKRVQKCNDSYKSFLTKQTGGKKWKLGIIP